MIATHINWAYPVAHFPSESMTVDILTHTLSGVAVATCVASFMPTPQGRWRLLLLGAVAGAFPDLDALSLWSGFDHSIGAYFGLSKGALIYTGQWWYSHHAFLHSIAASLLLASLWTLGRFGVNRLRQRHPPKRAYALALLTFILAYWAHLAGDLPTPSAYWDGVALFWPSVNYIGGTGQVWWWHNYDVFLLILLCVVLNIVVLACAKWLKQATPKLTCGIFLLTLSLVLYQINTRQYDYSYSGNAPNYTQMDTHARQEQQRILGPRLYGYMLAFERRLPVYF